MLRKLTVSTFLEGKEGRKKLLLSQHLTEQSAALSVYKYLTKITFKLYSVSLYKPGELLPKLGFQVPYL